MHIQVAVGPCAAVVHASDDVCGVSRGKANGWNFLAAATANPFDVKDGLLGGFGAVGKAFPFLNTTPQANGTKTAGSSPANTPPISPRAGGATPVIEISSWRPARARK
eukprot:1844936-Rhodomonas_salina.1